MEQPLMLVDGRFALVDMVFVKDGGVTIQGEFVGKKAPSEVILGDKVLGMVDLSRRPGHAGEITDKAPSEEQVAWWRLYDAVVDLAQAGKTMDEIVAEVGLAFNEAEKK
jgi:hypothetical protein